VKREENLKLRFNIHLKMIFLQGNQL